MALYTLWEYLFFNPLITTIIFAVLSFKWPANSILATYKGYSVIGGIASFALIASWWIFSGTPNPDWILRVIIITYFGIAIGVPIGYGFYIASKD